MRPVDHTSRPYLARALAGVLELHRVPRSRHRDDGPVYGRREANARTKKQPKIVKRANARQKPKKIERANMRTLAMWTIYDHPSDHPTAYIARKWLVGGGAPQPTTDALICGNLDHLRTAMISMGLTCLSRSPEDDPKIVETWL